MHLFFWGGGEGEVEEEEEGVSGLTGQEGRRDGDEGGRLREGFVSRVRDT